jgi:pyrophosphate--fructose-6-phosphate 1-phosphotransferase
VMNCKVVELHADFIYPYRNQGGFDIIGSGRDKIEKPEEVSGTILCAKVV